MHELAFGYLRHVVDLWEFPEPPVEELHFFLLVQSLLAVTLVEDCLVM